MTFNEYQAAAMKTALFRGAGDRLGYPGLGLAGEAGEVAGKIKKLDRDFDVLAMSDVQGVNPQREALFAALEAEMGDVLWYLAVMAETLGTNLEAIAEKNVAKLLSRFERGVIKGSGDNR